MSIKCIYKFHRYVFKFCAESFAATTDVETSTHQPERASTGDATVELTSIDGSSSYDGYII